MITKFFALSTLFFLTVTQPLLAFAQEGQSPMPPPSYYSHGPWHMWGGGCGVGWVSGLFFLFLVIVAIKLIFYRRHHHCGHCGHYHRMDRPYGPTYGSWNDPTNSSLQILNERLAKGEIQKAEYEEKKAAILSGQN